MTLLEYLKVGGQFTFPKSKATRTAEQMQARDLRRNLVSNSTRGYIKKARVPNRIRKALNGLAFKDIERQQYDMTNKEDSSYYEEEQSMDNVQINIPKRDDYKYEQQVKQLMEPKQEEVAIQQPTEDYSKYVGFNGFNKAYDEVEQEMPEARQYRNLLTKIAKQESAFKMNAKNPGAAAYGYFQFMQDGSKWNNIKQYSGLSIEEFTKDPKAQIKAAVKLAQSFYKSFKKEDIEKAQKMGISMTGLIGGAWLGGPGGVRKVLNGTGNPSDRNWNNGQGSDVATYIKMFNNL